MLSSLDKLKRNVLVPSNSTNEGESLCALIITFSNNQETVTSNHVFTSLPSQLYPQTRKTVFSNSSTVFSTSNEQLKDKETTQKTSMLLNSKQERQMLPTQSTHIVQEITLSYSPPYQVSKDARNYNQPIKKVVHVTPSVRVPTPIQTVSYQPPTKKMIVAESRTFEELTTVTTTLSKGFEKFDKNENVPRKIETIDASKFSSNISNSNTTRMDILKQNSEKIKQDNYSGHYSSENWYKPKVDDDQLNGNFKVSHFVKSDSSDLLSQKGRSVSRLDMNDNDSQNQKMFIIHNREKIILTNYPDTTPTPAATPIPTPIPTQNIKSNVEDKEVRSDLSKDLPVSPNQFDLPANEHHTTEENIQTTTIEESRTDRTFAETYHSSDNLLIGSGIEETKEPEQVLDAENVPKISADTDGAKLSTDKSENVEYHTENTPQMKEEIENSSFKEDVHIVDHRSTEEEFYIKKTEDWFEKTKRIKQLEPPAPNPPKSTNTNDREFTSYLSQSEILKKEIVDKHYSILNSRGYTVPSSELLSGNMISGLSSAGTVCTTQIRDAREREKREIGLLNDRLADYIEKVRFLEAQNQCLSHDIGIFRRGFSGQGHISKFFDSEIATAKSVLEQTRSSQAQFEKNIAGLSADVDDLKKKWLGAVSTIKAHREDHDVDLDKLAKIEAEVSLFKRKIRVVEEDVIRIQRENDGIYNEIARTRGNIQNENGLKNEQRLNVDDLLQRIKLLQSENSAKIEQELVFIKRDNTFENRDYFRHELQAAIREIRADYEAISLRNRNNIEIWYREQIRKIKESSEPTVDADLYKNELNSIRSTVISVRSRLAEVESRNFFLEKMVTDLRNSEEMKFYEISLAEKDAAIAKLRDQCTELSIQMERLCDNEISLRAEIEKYRILLNNANVTTHVPSVPVAQYSGATRVISQTTRTHSSSNISYSGIPASRIVAGGVLEGNSGSTYSIHAGSEPRPERIHDDQGTDENGRNYRSWYLGTISINKVTPQFIELKNICKIRKVDVGGYRIEQTVDNKLIGQCTINVPFVLSPQETIRIYTADQENRGYFTLNTNVINDSTSSRTSLYNAIEPNKERGWFVYYN